MGDYDPGSPFDDYDQRRRRSRRRRTENEIDDAWAAADQDDLYDDAAEIEDLAAGYVDDRLRPPRDSMNTEQISLRDLGPIKGAARRLQERTRHQPPRQERIRRHYDPEEAYADSPSYQANKRNILDRVLDPISGEINYTPSKPKRGVPSNARPPLPVWGIAMLVILGLVALLVVVFACGAAIWLMQG
ncbi:MAG TPA: hypothetical protein VHP83_14095 [Aggregatilineaceae bacterium]|nr:hypothetical protein [Aggregatilineaceae bacterium]